MRTRGAGLHSVRRLPLLPPVRDTHDARSHEHDGSNGHYKLRRLHHELLPGWSPQHLHAGLELLVPNGSRLVQRTERLLRVQSDLHQRTQPLLAESGVGKVRANMSLNRAMGMLLSLCLVHCGTAVAPNNDAAVDSSADAWTWRDCRGGRCPRGEVCTSSGVPEGLQIVCRPTIPGCEPFTPPCTGAECIGLIPCQPCVAASMMCPTGMRCMVERTRASLGFVDVDCVPE